MTAATTASIKSPPRAASSQVVSIEPTVRGGRIARVGANLASGVKTSSGPGWPGVRAATSVVAPAGFEPAISALRGLRPRPLDDGATLRDWWAALGLNQ